MLFELTCSCVADANKLKVLEPSYAGEVQRTVPQLQMVFQRLECDNLAQVSDFRFKYFTEKARALRCSCACYAR